VVQLVKESVKVRLAMWPLELELDSAELVASSELAFVDHLELSFEDRTTEKLIESQQKLAVDPDQAILDYGETFKREHSEDG